MNTNQSAIYRVVYILTDDTDQRIRSANVRITEGYTTVDSIPKILAVKHYSSNEPEHVAKINIMHAIAYE